MPQNTIISKTTIPSKEHQINVNKYHFKSQIKMVVKTIAPVHQNSSWIQNANRKFLETERHGYFEILNLLYSAEMLVQDMERSGTSPMVFSRLFPFSSWLSYFLLIFSEHFILCLAFDNYHFLDTLSKKRDLLKATVVWYLIFFFPGDVIQSFCRIDVVYLLLTIVKDIFSIKVCLKTVCLAREVYGKEALIVTMLATLAGNAPAFTIWIQRLVRGFWTPSGSEFLHPKFKSKVLFVVATVAYFAAERQRRCPDETIFLISVVFLSLYRTGALFGLNVDYVFDAFEQMFNEILYGISDKLGGLMRRLKFEMERLYTRIYNHFYPPPPPSRQNQSRNAHNTPSGRTARFAN